jgi:hypothetical protein
VGSFQSDRAVGGELPRYSPSKRRWHKEEVPLKATDLLSKEQFRFDFLESSRSSHWFFTVPTKSMWVGENS